MSASVHHVDLAIAVLAGKIAAWTLSTEAHPLPLQGQPLVLWNGHANALKELLYDGADRLNNEGDEVATVHWLLDRDTRARIAPQLADLSGRFPGAPDWHLLSWEWLAARLALETKDPLTERRADMEHTVLPWLMLANNADERRRQEAALMRSVESDRARIAAEHTRLQQENEYLRAQNAGLKSVDTEHLVSFLPALFSRVFNHIGPADLALLCGRIEPLNIPNPFPEFSEETLKFRQKQFRALPTHVQREIVGFVDRLPQRQKLTPRPEMREVIHSLQEA